MQGVRIQSLVRELRSHLPRGQKKPKNIKQNQYCNKFNKDFKNGPHQKNLKKKKISNKGIQNLRSKAFTSMPEIKRFHLSKQGDWNTQTSMKYYLWQYISKTTVDVNIEIQV